MLQIVWFTFLSVSPTTILSTAITFHPQTASYSLSITIKVPRVIPSQPSTNTASTDHDILLRLRSILNASSRLLYRATRQHAHIGQVTFFLPDDWLQDLNEFNETVEWDCCSSDSDCDSLSKIYIVPGRNDELERATVWNPRGCGKEAEGPLTIPSSLLLGSTISKAAKLFVHEFAHLRYGVGDEYSGTRYNEQRNVPLCPSARTRANATASLMADIHGDQVVDFCDNSGNPSTQHNPHADTDHNRICNNRSVWEVLREHSDFSNFAQPSEKKQPKLGTEIEPQFKFIRRCFGESVVFVVDKQLNNARYSKVHLSDVAPALKDYVSNFTTDHTHVALVTFGSTQNITNHNHRLLTTTESGRDKFISQLTTLNTTETDVSDLRSALKEAIKLAKSASTSLSSILLFSALSANRSASLLNDFQREDYNTRAVPIHAFSFAHLARRSNQPCTTNTHGQYCDVGDQSSLRVHLQQHGRHQPHTLYTSTKKVTHNKRISDLVVQSPRTTCSKWSSMTFLVHGNWRETVNRQTFCENFTLTISRQDHQAFSRRFQAQGTGKTQQLLSSLRSKDYCNFCYVCVAKVSAERSCVPLKFEIWHDNFHPNDVIKVEVTAKQTTCSKSCLASQLAPTTTVPIVQRKTLTAPTLQSIMSRTKKRSVKTSMCNITSLTTMYHKLVRSIPESDFMFLAKVGEIGNNNKHSIQRVSPMFRLSRWRLSSQVKQIYKLTSHLNVSRFCRLTCSLCAKLHVGKTYLVTAKRDGQCEKSHSTANRPCDFLLGKYNVMLTWQCNSRKRQACGQYALMRIAATTLGTQLHSV